MCTVTLNINEAQVRELNPSLTDMASINRWAQRQMDKLIAELTAELRRPKEDLKPYTIGEIHAMIDESERQIAAGQCKPIEEVFRRWDDKVAEEEAEYGKV